MVRINGGDPRRARNSKRIDTGQGTRGQGTSRIVLRIERLTRRTLVSSVSSIAAVSTVCKHTPVTRHEDESGGRNDCRARHRPRSGSGRGRGGRDGRRAGVRSATLPESTDRNVPGERSHVHPYPCGMDHPAHRIRNRLHGIPDPAPEVSPGPDHSPPFCCWRSERPYAPTRITSCREPLHRQNERSRVPMGYRQRLRL